MGVDLAGHCGHAVRRFGLRVTRPIWVEPAIAAHAADVTVRTVAKWARLGLIPPPDAAGRYDLTAIFNYYEGRSEGLKVIAAANRQRRGEHRNTPRKPPELH